ncbi:MAG: hypothetical protein GY711_00635 [bacterium]|nr:hypothetical protein [bacterium]
MKIADPRLWLGLLSMAIVTGLVYVDLERTTPGELSAAHAQVASLTGDDGCSSCHGAQRDALAESCIGCHTVIGEQLEARSGFHGLLEDARLCARCHLEHEGANLALAGEHAFTVAGIADRDAYDHDGLAFDLHGTHASLTCEQCHPLANAPFLATGEVRFLGLEDDCARCHEDPHGGDMSHDCESCHGQERPFAEVAEFAHTPQFALSDAHAEIVCSACHETGGERSIAMALEHGAPEVRGCSACHDSPHDDGFDADGATTCSACHTAVDGGFGPATDMESDLHALTSFPLTPPHDGVACADCHAGATFAARHPGRRADDCAACHDDPHGGQFDAVPSAACVTCHPTSFAPHGFDVEQHAATAFPLAGAHGATECHACHVLADESKDALRTFRGTPNACEACHADAHEGAFDELGPPRRPDAEGCARCHTTESFEQTARTSFDHDAWTRFPLAGAHAALECETCHVPAPRPDALGRRFGRVAEHFPGNTDRCSTCHADPHGGAFTGASRPAVVGDQASCARCHTQDSFADVPDFDHGAWTGFVLDGGHARTSCATCHPRTPQPGATGRSFARASETFPGSVESCATCHVDPHGGVFAAAGTTDCARCHTTETFHEVRDESFDHARATGFPLFGAHNATACTDCHASTAPDERGRTFGHAPGTACSDCHADPHVGQFAKSGSTDCARCHTAAASFEQLTFDHENDARFALDEVHERLACSACHVAWRLADGREAVRYRPLGRECADCHDPGIGGKKKRQGGGGPLDRFLRDQERRSQR